MSQETQTTSADGLDEAIQRLQSFFREHPTWVKAAKPVVDGANSEVFFVGHDAPWRLVRIDGVSILEPGQAESPDFSFYFSFASIDALTSAPRDASIADFAITLFDYITAEDTEARIGFRICAPFRQLLRRGYLRVLLRGGPSVLRYISTRGVKTLNDFNAIITAVRSDGTFDWAKFGREGWNG